MKQKFTQKAMNKKYNKKWFYGLILVLSVSLIGFSETKDTFAVTKSTDTCLLTFSPFVEWRTLEFATFLDIQFASKKNNTYLIADTITAFREYKKKVMDELNSYSLGITSTVNQFVQLEMCTQLANQKIANAKSMLSNHVQTTSGVKHGEILLEKYRDINKKMAEMNFQLGKIAGAYAGFENKFPGYSKDCLTGG